MVGGRAGVYVALALTLAAGSACGDDDSETGSGDYCRLKAEVEQAMSESLREATTGGSIPADFGLVAAHILDEHLGDWRRVQAAAPFEIAEDRDVVMGQWERIAAGKETAPDDEGIAAEARIAGYEQENC